MEKSEDSPQRMNSEDEEASLKTTNLKDKKSDEATASSSSASSSRLKSCVKAAYVGRDVEIRLKNNKIINGICVDPGLGSVFKLQNAYVSPGAGFEPFVFNKNIHHAELQLPNADIVDVSTTLGKPRKKFTTDREYSTNYMNNDENIKLVEWDGGESSEQQLDNNPDIFRSGGGNKIGWSVDDMFKRNEALGVQSSFKDDLTQYTTCAPTGSEEDKVRAARIAREIETNDKSKHLAFLENDDEERDLDKETNVTEDVEPKVEATVIESSFIEKNKIQEEEQENDKKKFQFNPDAPAFVPKPYQAQSVPLAASNTHQLPGSLMPHPPNPQQNQIPPQQFIVNPNMVGGNVVTSTYMHPQGIPVMPIYNHQVAQSMQTMNPQSMQAIPPLIQALPQNVIIRNEYPATYAPIQIQQMPMFRMAMPAQPQQQNQQPIGVYQFAPQLQQQQHYQQQQIQQLHYQPQQQQQQPRHQSRHSDNFSGANHQGGNNGGNGRTRRNNNYHNNNNWSSNQNPQSSSSQHQQPQQRVTQPRYPQGMQANPVFMPQMGPVYVNQNAAMTTPSSNNVVHSNMIPVNMIPQQYAVPQQIYQRVEQNHMNGMVGIQGQIPQNAIMVTTPAMGMPPPPMHHGGNQIMHSQPPTPAAPTSNLQETSPSMHFPPNFNVPPPPIQKNMGPRYAMQQAPVVISNSSQMRITPLMAQQTPTTIINSSSSNSNPSRPPQMNNQNNNINGPPPSQSYRRTGGGGGGRRRD